MLPNRLRCLSPLPCLIHFPALHYPLHDLAGIDVLELVLCNFLVYPELFCCRIWIVRERYERCGSVIDDRRKTEGEGLEVRSAGREGCAEDDA